MFNGPPPSSARPSAGRCEGCAVLGAAGVGARQARARRLARHSAEVGPPHTSGRLGRSSATLSRGRKLQRVRGVLLAVTAGWRRFGAAGVRSARRPEGERGCADGKAIGRPAGSRDARRRKRSRQCTMGAARATSAGASAHDERCKRGSAPTRGTRELDGQTGGGRDNKGPFVYSETHTR